MISHNKKIIYIDIPKTGSSSLRNVLLDESCTNYPHSELLNSTVKKAHTRPARWKNFIDPSKIELEDFFVFTVVRNPFDRFCSYWRWRNYGCSFDEFVEDTESFDYPHHLDPGRWYKPMLDWISYDDGTVCTDYIGRFEELLETWEHLKNKLNIDEELPHIRATESSGHYKTYYNSHTRKIVEERFRRDLDYFNYDF